MEPIDGLTSTNYKAGSVSNLQMAISSVFSRWDGLQMAIENQWGGRDSHQKSLNLVSDVFSWFSHSKPPLYVEDLENLLHETLLLSFNTEIEDGSIEQVAEQLMMIYEENLVGSR
ncbi:pre-rRNA-processing protein TSR2 isoform X2 [Cucumis sativus]|uniref:Pre-rRNA-processing protein TSR2 homolog n=1 Tax=Cucumis sativus TaxID=3659 RepID=A0A0A0L7I9_CUCSA|nr:pre-rRNA-processing protein TSR2 isoform X2 [Cucumis sativus]